MPETRDICFACARAMHYYGTSEMIECMEGIAGSSKCLRYQHFNKICITPTGDAQVKFRVLAAELASPSIFQNYHEVRSNVTKILAAAPADQDAPVVEDAAKAEYKAEMLELLRRQTVAMETIAEALKKFMAP